MIGVLAKSSFRGPDDKPRMTFASRAEFNEWDKPRVMAQMETGIPRGFRWIWLTGISILIGLMLGFIVWRRSKTAHRPKMAPGSSSGLTLPSSEP